MVVNSAFLTKTKMVYRVTMVKTVQIPKTANQLKKNLSDISK